MTPELQEILVGQLKAFLHASIDEEIVLVNCRRKSDSAEVLVAAIRHNIKVPSPIVGGPTKLVEQLVPVFEFVDPTSGENPYVAIDPDFVEASSAGGIIVPDSATKLSGAVAGATTDTAPAENGDSYVKHAAPPVVGGPDGGPDAA